MNDLSIAFERDVLVTQYPYAELAEVLAPFSRTGVVLVIAGHEEGAIPRREFGEQRDMWLAIFDTAIHHASWTQVASAISAVPATKPPPWT
jgi:hypothetical protein